MIPRPPDTILDVLRAAHRVVSTLLEELTDTGADERERRTRLLAAVREELEVLARSEEVTFAEVLRRGIDARAPIRRAREESEACLRALGDLDGAPAGERWSAAMAGLSASVARHIEVEERELLPVMAAELAEAEAEALAITYRAERARIEGERRAAIRRGGAGEAAAPEPRPIAETDEERRRLDAGIVAEIDARLREHPQLSSAAVEIHVVDGEVTLAGVVDDRALKYGVEEVVEAVAGVTDVYNLLSVREGGGEEEPRAAPPAPCPGRVAGVKAP